MAASEGLANISKILECAFCLDTVTNPRLLNCNHCYCKRCLDTLLDFALDGSAVIKCPKGCRENTSISRFHTTNDLAIDFMLKGIIDVVNEKDKAQQRVGGEEYMCTSRTNCEKEGCAYCIICDIFICQRCSDGHDEKHKDDFVPVYFDGKEQKLRILCKEHSTEAFLVCGDSFVCSYCVHRSHREHMHNTIEYETTQLKETLHAEIKRLSTFMEKLNVTLRKTESDITTATANLDTLLKKRKIDCLNDYFRYLNKEEEMIKEKFNTVTKSHLDSFKVQDMTEYFAHNISKESWKLDLQKRPIMLKVAECRNNCDEDVTKVSISISDHGFHSRHPLGEMNIVYSGTKLFVHPHSIKQQTFECEFPTEDSMCTSVKLLEKLQDDLRKLDPINTFKQGTSAEVLFNRVDGTDITRSSSGKNAMEPCGTVSKEVTPMVMDSDSDSELYGNDHSKVYENNMKMTINESARDYEKGGSYYIENLIEGKENDKLMLLLSERPDIISETYGSSPNLNQAIHMAARYNNLKFMKELIRYDASLADIKNAAGSTALHISALHSASYPCSRWLVRRHAHLTCEQNNKGCTALHNATSKNDLKTIALLLNCCTCKSILMKDKYGNNPLDLAKEDGYRNALKVLQTFLNEKGKVDNGAYAHCADVDAYQSMYGDD